MHTFYFHYVEKIIIKSEGAKTRETFLQSWHLDYFQAIENPGIDDYSEMDYWKEQHNPE